MDDKQVWQIAAGTVNRNYTKLFYDYGIAIIGPGFEGEWDENKYENSDKVGERDKSLLKRFATEVKPNDYIILKVGKDAEAIGMVEEYKNGKAYFWNENFKYIDGWQLGHCLKVKWARPENGKKLKLKNGLAEQKFCLYGGDVKDIEREYGNLKPSKPSKDINVLKLPVILNDENYGEHLKLIFKEPQFISSDLKKFWNEISELKEYAIKHETSHYSEEETKIFFILSILKALGWSNEHIAIEHKNVDILLSYNGFCDLDFDNEEEKDKVDFIIESKRVDEGLRDAVSQLESYLKNFKKISYGLVSNGLVSYIYKNEVNKLVGPIACLDIENLWIENLPYDNEVKGAKEFINLMLYKKFK